MSRIGNKHISVPAGLEVTIEENLITVKGSKGTLSTGIPAGITVKHEGESLIVTRANDSKQLKTLHGTTRALIANCVEGVTNGYKIELEIVGIGYKAAKRGEDLVLNLGYSHEIVIPAEAGVTVDVPKPTAIVVEGISKERVGQMAALIRSKRKPEPYGGKGVMYKGEHIIRKEGKRAGSKK